MAIVMVGAVLWAAEAQAQVLATLLEPGARSSVPSTAPNRDAAASAEVTADIPARLHRQQVNYTTTEAPGAIVVDTPNTYLYFVLGGGKAIRYGIGVGRDGRTGYHPRRCCSGNPISRASWPVVLAIRSVRARCI
jgi:lipoprotein-anchoring transpeptidase ErfK/SrfK